MYGCDLLIDRGNSFPQAEDRLLTTKGNFFWNQMFVANARNERAEVKPLYTFWIEAIRSKRHSKQGYMACMMIVNS